MRLMQVTTAGRWSGRCLALIMGLSGCAKSDHLPTFPVSGEVVLSNGQPLSAGTILLESTEHPVTARGVIQAGKFTLGTYDTEDGAVQGQHRVAIIPTAPADYDPDGNTPLESIQSKYMQLDTSQLTADIPAGGRQDLRFQVD